MSAQLMTFHSHGKGAGIWESMGPILLLEQSRGSAHHLCSHPCGQRLVTGPYAAASEAKPWLLVVVTATEQTKNENSFLFFNPEFSRSLNLIAPD